VCYGSTTCSARHSKGANCVSCKTHITSYHHYNAVSLLKPDKYNKMACQIFFKFLNRNYYYNFVSFKITMFWTCFVYFKMFLSINNEKQNNILNEYAYCKIAMTNLISIKTTIQKETNFIFKYLKTAGFFLKYLSSHIYCSNKCTIKTRRCIINKVVPTCFGACASSAVDHSSNSNIKLKNNTGCTAPALRTTSLKHALLKLV
jgi:hypothetical protein